MSAFRKPYVICVDDEKIILDSLQEQVINRIGDRFECEVAQSGEEALELIDDLLNENQQIAVIISDQLMPSMKGDEFLIAAHKKVPDAYKILLTGQATLDAVRNAINHARLYRYVMKPWREEDLMLTVEEAAEAFLQKIRLQLYMRLLRDINSLTQKISGERDLNRLIEKYFEGLADTVGFSVAKAYIAHPQYHIMLAAQAEIEAKIQSYASKPKTIVADAYSNPEFISKVRQEIEEILNQVLLEGSQQALVAPIRLQQGGAQEVGYVVLQRSEGMDFMREQREIQSTLQTLTSQLAISLENAAFYKTILEQKQELEESIRYARRIQQALLPNIELIKYYLPESFILYLPKAVVSGDFYWFAEQDGNIYLAAADCTGHGVPGAFMSVLVSNALSYAVSQQRISDPGAILEHGVDMQVREKLQTQEGPLRDGAEIALVQINLTTRELLYAGAKRPLIYYRGGTRYEVPATPRAIADDLSLVGTTHFETVRLNPQVGDTFYLFSDGYQDQEGFEKPRLGKRRFYEILDEIHKLPMEEQARLLRQKLLDWKGSAEQTDDILVIGFRWTMPPEGGHLSL
jgi:serine phosphatase RsbU (regulator of sigma subunit)/DNA-binding NarL/FixJ family response regulator